MHRAKAHYSPTERPQVSRNLRQRANTLMNPTSTLAADYINAFNEIIMLIEHLPDMPELIHNIQAWQARSYTDYFTRSPLPECNAVLYAYGKLDAGLKADFENIIGELQTLASNCVLKVNQCAAHPCQCPHTCLTRICSQSTKKLRATLSRARQLINPTAANDAVSEQDRIDAYFK